MRAELVLKGGNVVSMTGPPRRGHAIAIADGRIVAVDSDERLEPVWREAQHVVDLQGTTVLPGLIDTHVHLVRTGLSMLGPLLPRPHSVTELVEMVAAAAHSTSDDPLILYGGGVRGLDRAPTRWDLDPVTADRPTLLSDPSGHVSLVNTAAWERMHGLAAAEGADASGLLVTWANKRARHWFHSRVPRERITAGLHRATQAALRRGVTTLHAMDGGDYLGDDDVPALLDTRGELCVDLIIYPQVMDLDAVAGWGLPRVGGCILLDGAYGEHTAALQEAYADAPDTRGVLFHSNAEVERLVTEAHARGLQVTVHAQGDAAIEQVLRAYERALTAHPRADHRHRIEHCGLPTADQIERIAHLGIGLGMQPVFAAPHPSLEAMFGAERMRRRHQYRMLRERGIVVGGGSDADASPIDPLAGVAAAVALDSDRRLTVEEALQLFTTNAAWLAFEEDDKGSIRPGARADLAILSADPFTAELGSIEVLRTFRTGQQVWSAEPAVAGIR